MIFLSFVETANAVSQWSESNSLYSSNASIALIRFAILSLDSSSDSFSWSRSRFRKLYRPVTGAFGEGVGCSGGVICSCVSPWLSGRFTGLVGGFAGASVGCSMLSGVREGITILKLFNFSQGGSSTTGNSSSLGLPTGLRTVRTLGVPCRCSPRRFNSTVPPFVSSLKSTTLDLIVVCKSSA